MFSYVQKKLGIVNVSEENRVITISGVPSYFMQNDMKTIYKTSRIGQELITPAGGSKFSIDSFFALELKFVLESMLGYSRKLSTSKRTIQQIIDGLYENTWLKKTLEEPENRLDYGKLSLFHKKPLEFQEGFLKTYNNLTTVYNLRGYLLAGTAGSGKTLMGLYLCEMLKKDNVVIVCPPNAVDNVWEKSILEEYKKPPTYWLSKHGKEHNGEKFLVFHYEALNKALDIVPKLRGKTMIILDESHYLNEFGSLRSRLFQQLIDTTRDVEVLEASGTPVKAMGLEVIPLLRAIDPIFTAEVEHKFVRLYGKNAKAALALLSQRLDVLSYKVTKPQLGLKDPVIENIAITTANSKLYTLEAIKVDMANFVLNQTAYYESRKKLDHAFYQKCIDQYLNKSLSDRDKKAFDLYERNIKVVQKTDIRYCKEEAIYCNKYEATVIIPALPKDWVNEFRNVKTIVKYVKLKIQGECLGRILGKKRAECALEIARAVNYVEYTESTVKKTLVFTSYVEALETAAQEAIHQGLNPLMVYGKTNSELKSIVKIFFERPDANPLIATFNSLSTAVPLTAADVLVMLNVPFRDYVLQQTISRINRLGADTIPHIYLLYLDTGGEPNLTTRGIDILKWSQEQVEAITGVKSPFEVSDANGKISLEGYSGGEFIETDLNVSFESMGICESMDTGDSHQRPNYLKWK